MRGFSGSTNAKEWSHWHSGKIGNSLIRGKLLMQYKKKFETTVKKEQKDRATKDFKKQKSAEKKKSKEIL